VRPRPTYREIDREEVPPGNPVDMAVHRRVGRPALMRKLAMASQAVVDALGRRRQLWFAYEEALGRLTSRQQAAYFDLGVEHGIAAARADQLRAGRAVKKLAERLVREALGANVSREDVAAAAVMAAWAVLGRRTDLRDGRRATPSTSPATAGSAARGSSARSPRPARLRRPAL
jgi:hypothetical protein